MGKREKPAGKKKYLPMVIIAVAIVVAVLIAALVFIWINSENRASDVVTIREVEINEDGTISAKNDETAGSGQENSNAGNTSGAADESESGTDGENGAPDGSSGTEAEINKEGALSAKDNTDNTSGTADGGKTGTSENEDTVVFSFPYTSSLDELKLVAVYNYSGYYIEDGSEEEIDSVAVLEVTNLSAQVIEYATITLTADGKELNFELSLLPAGETALVMEADKQSCSETASFSYGGSEIASLSSLDLCEDQVTVSTDSGAVTVTNISGNDISELRLFYKNQLDTGEYVGGIAYTVKLEDLAAGESQTVYPSHFDPEYGVVMMVRIY